MLDWSSEQPLTEVRFCKGWQPLRNDTALREDDVGEAFGDRG